MNAPYRIFFTLHRLLAFPSVHPQKEHRNHLDAFAFDWPTRPVPVRSLFHSLFITPWQFPNSQRCDRCAIHFLHRLDRHHFHFDPIVIDSVTRFDDLVIFQCDRIGEWFIMFHSAFTIPVMFPSWTVIPVTLYSSMSWIVMTMYIPSSSMPAIDPVNPIACTLIK